VANGRIRPTSWDASMRGGMGSGCRASQDKLLLMLLLGSTAACKRSDERHGRGNEDSSSWRCSDSPAGGAGVRSSLTELGLVVLQESRGYCKAAESLRGNLWCVGGCGYKLNEYSVSLPFVGRAVPGRSRSGATNSAPCRSLTLSLVDPMVAQSTVPVAAGRLPHRLRHSFCIAGLTLFSRVSSAHISRLRIVGNSHWEVVGDLRGGRRSGVRLAMRRRLWPLCVATVACFVLAAVTKLGDTAVVRRDRRGGERGEGLQ
jgi:hypothetical protein